MLADDIELTELAQVLIGNYLPAADSHTDYLHLAILEFEDFRRKGIPYTCNGEIVSTEEFLATIDNILRFRLASGESA